MTARQSKEIAMLASDDVPDERSVWRCSPGRILWESHMQFVRGFFAVSLIVALPVLSACVPAVVVSGAAVGVMSVHDRRSTGVQTDDELTEWKASNRLPQRLANAAHVNFVSYNRVLLITGEAVDEETRAAIGSLAAAVEGVKKVHNELGLSLILLNRSRSRYINA